MIKIWIAIIIFLLTSEALCQRQGLDFLKKQNDYKVIPERAELVRYNERIVRHATIATFKYNRTCAAINASFIANAHIGYDMQVVVQAFKFMSNEYREFPLRFQMNACDALSHNIGGTANWSCGNFTGCPIQKNKKYYICNWTVDESKLPPHIPTGKYMLELQWLFHGKEAVLTQAYAAVERPITVQ